MENCRWCPPESSTNTPSQHGRQSHRIDYYNHHFASSHTTAYAFRINFICYWPSPKSSIPLFNWNTCKLQVQIWKQHFNEVILTRRTESTESTTVRSCVSGALLAIITSGLIPAFKRLYQFTKHWKHTQEEEYEKQQKKLNHLSVWNKHTNLTISLSHETLKGISG